MDTIIISDGIFDPVKGFVRGMALHIRNGIVARITRDIAIPPGAEVVILNGQSVAPMFCDYHLHFFPGHAEHPDTAFGELLRYGIGQVYDSGDAKASGVALKRVLGSQIEIKAAGMAIYKTGGYGGALGVGVTSTDEAIAQVDKLATLGVDFIKIIASGIYIPGDDSFSDGGFTAKEIAEITAHSRKRSLAVHCHANGDDAIGAAVEAGVSVIIHGFEITGEILNTMAQKEIAFVPTLAALSRLATICDSEEALKNVDRMLGRHLSAAGKAYELGVSILPGSDAGAGFIPFGISYQEELKLLRKAGLPIEYILRKAVSEPVFAGRPADFVVLDGLNVSQVFVAGSAVYHT